MSVLVILCSYLEYRAETLPVNPACAPRPALLALCRAQEQPPHLDPFLQLLKKLLMQEALPSFLPSSHGLKQKSYYSDEQL